MVVTENQINMYHAFRKEHDKLYVSLIPNDTKIKTTIITDGNNEIGISLYEIKAVR